jgi:hypothetical protein
MAYGVARFTVEARGKIALFWEGSKSGRIVGLSVGDSADYTMFYAVFSGNYSEVVFM